MIRTFKLHSKDIALTAQLQTPISAKLLYRIMKRLIFCLKPAYSDDDAISKNIHLVFLFILKHNHAHKVAYFILTSSIMLRTAIAYLQQKTNLFDGN